MKKTKSTKKLTIMVANPLTKVNEKIMIKNLSIYLQKLYYS